MIVLTLYLSHKSALYIDLSLFSTRFTQGYKVQFYPNITTCIRQSERRKTVQSLHNIQNSINTVNIHTGVYITNNLARISNTNFIIILSLANALDGSPPAGGVPCNDPFVQLISGGLGAFLFTLMQIGGAIGVICIVLGGLLRISALTTQKKEDKDERMSLSKLAFICALIVLIISLIFFILLVLLPNWYGLGSKTCN